MEDGGTEWVGGMMDDASEVIADALPQEALADFGRAMGDLLSKLQTDCGMTREQALAAVGSAVLNVIYREGKDAGARDTT